MTGSDHSCSTTAHTGKLRDISMDQDEIKPDEVSNEEVLRICSDFGEDHEPKNDDLTNEERTASLRSSAAPLAPAENLEDDDSGDFTSKDPMEPPSKLSEKEGQTLFVQTSLETNDGADDTTSVNYPWTRTAEPNEAQREVENLENNAKSGSGLVPEAEHPKDDILLEWGSLQRYRLSSVKGVALIIQMSNFSPQLSTEFGLTPKLDAEIDGLALSGCLLQTGCQMRHIRDPNRDEIVDLAASYSSMDSKERPSCFVMVFITHSVSPKPGSFQERLAAYDRLFTREDMLTYLVGEGLKNIPKILIYQAPLCGKPESSELSSAFNTLRRSTSGRKSTPNKSTVRSVPQLFSVPPDFLVVCSSIPEYYHFKNVKSGSEFIQRLVQGLLFNAKNPDMDFVKLLTRINGQFEHRNYLAPSSPGLFDPQHPSPNWAATEKPRYSISIFSTLTKQLFLF